jgi:hypothetical protein
VLAEKVRKNLLELRFSKRGDPLSEAQVVWGLVTGGHTLLTVYHVLDDNDCVVYDDNGVTVGFDLKGSIINFDVDLDLMTLQLPQRRSFASLLDYVPLAYHGSYGTVDEAVTINHRLSTTVMPHLVTIHQHSGEAVHKLAAVGDLGEGSCGSITIARVGNQCFLYSLHQLGKQEIDIAVSQPLTVLIAIGGDAAIYRRMATPVKQVLSQNGLKLVKNRPFLAGEFHPKSFRLGGRERTLTSNGGLGSGLLVQSSMGQHPIAPL